MLEGVQCWGTDLCCAYSEDRTYFEVYQKIYLSWLCVGSIAAGCCQPSKLEMGAADCLDTETDINIAARIGHGFV